MRDLVVVTLVACSCRLDVAAWSRAACGSRAAFSGGARSKARSAPAAARRSAAGRAHARFCDGRTRARREPYAVAAVRDLGSAVAHPARDVVPRRAFTLRGCARVSQHPFFITSGGEVVLAALQSYLVRHPCIVAVTRWSLVHDLAFFLLGQGGPVHRRRARLRGARSWARSSRSRCCFLGLLVKQRVDAPRGRRLPLPDFLNIEPRRLHASLAALFMLLLRRAAARLPARRRARASPCPRRCSCSAARAMAATRHRRVPRPLLGPVARGHVARAALQTLGADRRRARFVLKLAGLAAAVGFCSSSGPQGNGRAGKSHHALCSRRCRRRASTSPALPLTTGARPRDVRARSHWCAVRARGRRHHCSGLLRSRDRS